MLQHLFDAEVVYCPEMEPLTRDGEGELIGSGDGSVVGDRITGALAWTLFERPGKLRRYQWLDNALGVWEGEFDADAHRARYQAYVLNDDPSGVRP